MIIALNQYDVAEKSGIKIDVDDLSDVLGVPVVPTVASQGKNVPEALAEAIEVSEEGKKPEKNVRMGKDLEDIIDEFSKEIDEKIESIPYGFPSRTLAIMLIEGDKELLDLLDETEAGREIIKKADELTDKIEELHGEAAEFRIARERHGMASLVSERTTEHVTVEPSLSERIDRWTTDLKTGIPILVLVFIGLLSLLFFVGGFIEEIAVGGWERYIEPGLESLFFQVAPNGAIERVLNIGVNQGIKGILAVMLPYLPPFFLALAFLEDSGYLPRMAFVMDSLMHKIGLHGKAVAPMLGGFGCNVPAIMATRDLPDRRQRVISSFLITMVPCSARTAVILGTVGAFIGIIPALGIYGIILVLILLVGLVLNRLIPGETSGMVMEMPSLKKPMIKPVLSKTWNRLKEFVYVATPLLLLGSFLIGILDASGVIDSIVGPLSPFTLGVLGLPPITIIPLIYGVIRKEGALVLLFSVAGTSNLMGFMNELQIFVFALVVAIYLPCIATFAVLKNELGWKEAIIISVFTIVLSILIGALFFHLNPLGLSTVLG